MEANVTLVYLTTQGVITKLLTSEQHFHNDQIYY